MKKLMKLRQLIFIIFCGLLILPSIKSALRTDIPFRAVAYDVFKDDFEKNIERFPDRFKIVEFIKEETPKSSKILSFWESDIVYFSQRKSVRHLDPIMLNFYNAKSRVEALRYLKHLRIDYIYVPPWPVPTFFNSYIHEIVSDPEQCELDFECGGYRLYRLLKKNRAVQYSDIMINNDYFKLTSRGNAYQLTEWNIYNPNANDPDRPDRLIEKSADGEAYFTIANHGEENISLYQGAGAIWMKPGFLVNLKSTFNKSSKLLPNQSYRINAEVKGRGVFHLGLYEYSKNSDKITLKYLWTSALSEKFRKIRSLIRTEKDCNGYRILFLIPPKSKITIKSVGLERFESISDRHGISANDSDTNSWRVSFSSDFEQAKQGKLKATGWSVFPTPPDCKGGISKQGYQSQNALYIQQGDGNNYYIYTGQGAITGVPPSTYPNAAHCLVRPDQSGKYRIRAQLKGTGFAGLYVFWYGLNGLYDYKQLAWYYLDSDYKQIEKTFSLPKEAMEYRIGFRAGGYPMPVTASKKEKLFSTVYIDDVVLETELRKDSDDIVQRAADWRQLFQAGFEPWEEWSNIQNDWSVSPDSCLAGGEKCLTKDAYDGETAISLSQTNKTEPVYFYTGKGPLFGVMPSAYANVPLCNIEKDLSSRYQISAAIKGTGIVDLYVFWYTGPKQCRYQWLGRFDLNRNYRIFHRTFDLSDNANEYRVAFIVGGINSFPVSTTKSLSTLILDHVMVENLKTDPNALMRMEEKRWDTLFTSDFEIDPAGELFQSGWSVFPVDHANNRDGGLSTDSHSGQYALHLKQSDRSGLFYLHTGKGAISGPPPSDYAKTPICRVPNTTAPNFRLSVFMKGRGAVDLYVFWYAGKKYYRYIYLGRIYLSSAYRLIKRNFSLPLQATEYRIALRVGDPNPKLGPAVGGLSHLIVDDVRVENQAAESSLDAAIYGFKHFVARIQEGKP